MAFFSLGRTVTVGNFASAVMDLLASAVDSPSVVELGCFTGNGLAPPLFGLGRSNPVPVQISPFPLICEEDPNAPPSLSTLAVLWTVAPVAPVNCFRRCSLFTNTSTNGFIWTFPRGLRIVPAASMLLYNLANAASLTSITWVIDE